MDNQGDKTLELNALLINPLEKKAHEVVAFELEHKPGQTGNLWHNIIALAETGAIKAALEAASGNQTEAAEMLGVNRNTLRERIGRYNLRGYGVNLLR